MNWNDLQRQTGCHATICKPRFKHKNGKKIGFAASLNIFVGKNKTCLLRMTAENRRLYIK